MIEKDLQSMYTQEVLRNISESVKTIPRNNTELAIQEECNRVAELLIAKNRSYGNSALEPTRIFSKSDNIEQIKVRIDDKLSRFVKGEDFPGDDNLDDLMGYLVLLSIAQKETWK